MTRPRCDDTIRTLIDSEHFSKVIFEIKDKHLIVHGGTSGTIAIALSEVDKFTSEMQEIKEMYI